MDDIAYDSGLTQVDRAERARKAWALYAQEHSDVLADFLSDLLHLAEVDEIESSLGDGAHGAVITAMRTVLAETPTFPTDAESVWPYLAQMRLGRTVAWMTVGGANEPLEAAQHLRLGMQAAGFHTGELTAHCEDLAEGYELVADGGQEFRVISKTDAAAESEA